MPTETRFDGVMGEVSGFVVVPVVLVPVVRKFVEPWLARNLGWTGLFEGPKYGIGMLAAGIVLVRERMDRSLCAPGDARSWLNLQELGVIPSGTSEKRRWNADFHSKPNNARFGRMASTGGS